MITKCRNLFSSGVVIRCSMKFLFILCCSIFLSSIARADICFLPSMECAGAGSGTSGDDGGVTPKPCTDTCANHGWKTSDNDCSYGSYMQKDDCDHTCYVCKDCTDTCANHGWETSDNDCSYGSEKKDKICGKQCYECKECTPSKDCSSYNLTSEPTSDSSTYVVCDPGCDKPKRYKCVDNYKYEDGKCVEIKKCTQNGMFDTREDCDNAIKNKTHKKCVVSGNCYTIVNNCGTNEYVDEATCKSANPSYSCKQTSDEICWVKDKYICNEVSLFATEAACKTLADGTIYNCSIDAETQCYKRDGLKCDPAQGFYATKALCEESFQVSWLDMFEEKASKFAQCLIPIKPAYAVNLDIEPDMDPILDVEITCEQCLSWFKCNTETSHTLYSGGSWSGGTESFVETRVTRNKCDNVCGYTIPKICGLEDEAVNLDTESDIEPGMDPMILEDEEYECVSNDEGCWYKKKKCTETCSKYGWKDSSGGCSIYGADVKKICDGTITCYACRQGPVQVVIHYDAPTNCTYPLNLTNKITASKLQIASTVQTIAPGTYTIRPSTMGVHRFTIKEGSNGTPTCFNISGGDYTFSAGIEYWITPACSGGSCSGTGSSGGTGSGSSSEADAEITCSGNRPVKFTDIRVSASSNQCIDVCCGLNAPVPSSYSYLGDCNGIGSPHGCLPTTPMLKCYRSASGMLYDDELSGSGLESERGCIPGWIQVPHYTRCFGYYKVGCAGG